MSARVTVIALLLASGAAALSLALGPLGWSAEALALRGPRVALALVTGAALAGAGAALQTMFRNPLVAPDLLGVSQGAAAGAAGAVLLGWSAWGVQGLAFVGGVAAAGIALACARAVSATDVRLALVLCGIVTGALASAVLAGALFLADPYAQLPSITFWLLGSFARAAGGEVVLAAALAAAGLGTLLWLGFRLDALGLGDEQATSLGLNPQRLRQIAVGAATLATSAVVAASGIVGWIGLLVPHALRPLVGWRASALVPASMAGGALFAVLLDGVARGFGPVELPVGLLAAGLGAPAFLALFVLGRDR